MTHREVRLDGDWFRDLDTEGGGRAHADANSQETQVLEGEHLVVE